MSDPHQTGDWPTKAVPLQTPPADLRVSEDLERELRLQRKKRLPAIVVLGLGIIVAAAGYALYAAQQGSFSSAGAKIDSELSDAKATSVAAGQRAVVATGDAAREAGANIDTAIDRATAETPPSDASSKSDPKN